jgi:histone H3/H4
MNNWKEELQNIDIVAINFEHKIVKILYNVIEEFIENLLEETKKEERDRL